MATATARPPDDEARHGTNRARPRAEAGAPRCDPCARGVPRGRARPGFSTPVLLRHARHAWSTASAATATPLRAALREAGTGQLALQYNPFSYGHWGVASGLLAELVAARLRGALQRLVLVVHEPFVVMPGLRYTLMGAVQWRPLGVLMRLADDILATTESWLAVLDSVSAGSRAVAMPSLRTCPTGVASAPALRASAGTLVVSTFGMTHPHQLVGPRGRCDRGRALRCPRDRLRESPIMLPTSCRSRLLGCGSCDQGRRMRRNWRDGWPPRTSSSHPIRTA